MSVIVCPKCKGTLEKGAWEIVPRCPSCDAELPKAAVSPEQMVRKIVVKASLFAFLSFVPVLGFVFGLFGVFWGYLAASKQRVIVGATAMFISAVIGLVVNPFASYWAYGQAMDITCDSDMRALCNDIAACKTSCGDVPKDLACVSASCKHEVIDRCRAGGGKYLYYPPGTQPEAPKFSKPPEYDLPPWPAFMLSVYAPTVGPWDRTLLVAEAKPTHRHVRMCITQDLVVRALPHAEFATMMAEPQNKVLADFLMPPPAKPKPLKNPEEPNRRILGLSPKDLLWVAAGAILVLNIVGLGILRSKIRKTRREAKLNNE